jgi:hypothetical protein
MNTTLKQKLEAKKKMTTIVLQRETNVKFNDQTYVLKSVCGDTCELRDRYSDSVKSVRVADLELDLIDINLILNDNHAAKLKVDWSSRERADMNDFENRFFSLATKALIKMGFTPSQCQAIEQKACEDGHAYGYGYPEVLLKIIDYSEFAKLILGK